ncbi:MAG: FlgO family outer membrane protein [Elusimicrobiota bacterium]
MKNIKKFFVGILIVILLPVFSYAKGDPYLDMAKEFSAMASELTNRKIAIVPFSFIDNRPDVDGAGSILSERLTNRIVKLKQFKLVDRQNLEKVLQEQKLQASGLIDSETAKSLGKILGVDAIITGTMMNISLNRLEVNAKLIKTETAEILAVSSMLVEKDWITKAGEEYVEPAPVYAAQKTYAKRRPQNANFDGFFDLFMMTGDKGTMNLTFKNSVYGIAEADLRLDVDGDRLLGTRVSEVNFDSAETYLVGKGLGIRFAGFVEYFGFSFEVFGFSQMLSEQDTKYSYNNGRERNFSFYVDDYLKVTTVTIDFGLYLRLLKKAVQPYVGAAIGLSVNKLYSPYISSYDSTLIWQNELDALAVGFALSVPVGVRLCLGDSFTVFGEMRQVTNTVAFDRNIKSEKDKIITKNTFMLVGLGAKF